MVEVVRDGIWLCGCCLQAAVNGEPCDCQVRCSVVDLPHDEDVEAGLEELSKEGHLVPDYDLETGDGHYEFSTMGCDCCNLNKYKGGELHRFAILGEAS